MSMRLKDMERENLLDYLDACLDFVDESRMIGSVLVHCFAGVSRSAAVITAYLMRTESVPLEEALESLRKSCGTICSNDGFLEQLKMFEEMGFTIDRDSSVYNPFRSKVLGDSFNRGEVIDSSKFAADPSLPTNSTSSASGLNPKGGNNSTHAYCCKKCRRVVALQENHPLLGSRAGAATLIINLLRLRAHRYWWNLCYG